MNTKPTATFQDLLGWDTSHERIHAFLYRVNHPVIGKTETATTSRILSIGYDDKGKVNKLETRNTLYTRE